MATLRNDLTTRIEIGAPRLRINLVGSLQKDVLLWVSSVKICSNYSVTCNDFGERNNSNQTSNQFLIYSLFLHLFFSHQNTLLKVRTKRDMEQETNWTQTQKAKLRENTHHSVRNGNLHLCSVCAASFSSWDVQTINILWAVCSNMCLTFSLVFEKNRV